MLHDFTASYCYSSAILFQAAKFVPPILKPLKFKKSCSLFCNVKTPSLAVNQLLLRIGQTAASFSFTRSMAGHTQYTIIYDRESTSFVPHSTADVM